MYVKVPIVLLALIEGSLLVFIPYLAAALRFDGLGPSEATPTGRAVRVFGALEQARLDTDCRGFLVHLENVGILSPTQRELVIDRLMALEGDEIDLEKLKWVVLMVLFSQPGQETAFSRMEDLVFEERHGAVH